MSLREQLIRSLGKSNVARATQLGDRSPLISTGVLDSLALFNLTIWVEEQVGAPVDPTTFDLATEWNTIGGILRFVESHRASAAANRTQG
jgi:acyl carrier protein